MGVNFHFYTYINVVEGFRELIRDTVLCEIMAHCWQWKIHATSSSTLLKFWKSKEHV